MIGFRRKLYSPRAGFLCIDLPYEYITSVADHNTASGFGKKSSFVPSIKSATEACEQLNKLRVALRKEEIDTHIPNNTTGNHVEITTHLHDYDGVFYSDLDTENITFAFLEAVYLQKCHELKRGLRLPIFKYSPERNIISLIPANDYSHEELKNIWRYLCKEYFRNQVKYRDEEDLFTFLNKSNEEIKCLLTGIISTDYKSLDSCYELKLNTEIYDLIELEKEQLLLKVHNNLRETTEKDISNRERSNRFIADAYSSVRLSSNWIKLAICNYTDIAAVLKHMPSKKRFVFLNDLGVRWLSSLSNYKDHNHLMDECLEWRDSNEIYYELRTYRTVLQVHNLIKNGETINAQKIHNETCWPYRTIISYTDNNGFNSLHWAVICGNVDLVKNLIQQGANIHALNKFGESILHLAVWYGHVELVEYFLAKGFDPNQATYKNKTPIAGALHFKHPEIVALLVKYGATLYNGEKLRALSIANNPDSFEILLNQFTPLCFSNPCFVNLYWHEIYDIIKQRPSNFDLLVIYGLPCMEYIDKFIFLTMKEKKYHLAVYFLQYLVNNLPTLLPFENSDPFEYLKEDYFERKTKLGNKIANGFLQRTFKQFGQYIIQFHSFDSLAFFLKHLALIKCGFLQFNKLSVYEIKQCLTIVTETLSSSNFQDKEGLLHLHNQLTLLSNPKVEVSVATASMSFYNHHHSPKYENKTPVKTLNNHSFKQI
jgi:hypothetical protein